MSHFVAYILRFQEIIVYKIPPGGVYSQPKVYMVWSQIWLVSGYLMDLFYKKVSFNEHSWLCK